jgi:cytochrome P450
VGAPLARLELQEALRALTTRFGPPVLTDGPVVPDALGTVAPSELPVAFALR